MYHISDVKKYLKCPVLFYKHTHEVAQEYRPFVRLDEELTELACQKLGVEECFLGHRGDDKNLAIEALKNNEWLVKARFEYDKLRIKVPIMHKTASGYDIYFVYCGNYPHMDDLQYYVQTVWVLKNLRIFINDCYILHFNENYVRGDYLDSHDLFIITDSFYNDHKQPSMKIKDAIFANMRNYTNILSEMEKIQNGGIPTSSRTSKCSKRTRCIYYNECFEEELSLPHNSILTLSTSAHKYEMYKSGIRYLKDANFELIEGTRLQYAQIMADKNGGRFIDVHAIKGWLSTLKYPLYFLDFEWETYAIPPYKNMKPYTVLPFEYSIHVLEENGEIKHYEYVGIKDCREELIDNMIKDLGHYGSIIAYNAKGAEMLRIQEMMQQFPHKQNSLGHIYNRMIDMQDPILLGMYYDTKMGGSYTLKSIMATLHDDAYQSLDINQGMEAVFNWRQLDKDETIDKESIVANLKKYCGMDTYSMIELYKKLKEYASYE